MNYFKILRIIEHGNLDFLDLPVDYQIHFLSSLKTPEDDIDRSFNQYLCQRFFMPVWKRRLLDLVAAISFLPLILFFYVRGFFVYNKERIDAYGDFFGIEEILPPELKAKYCIEIRNWPQKKALFLRDLKPIFKLLTKHPLSPTFFLKNVVKLSSYSYILKSFAPQAIIVHNEPSYTSSFLTMYCEMFNVKHINVMHGEKLLYIRDSFFRFDLCYVWADYYIELFNALRVDANQMRVAVPPSLKIDVDSFKNKKFFSDFKYYLADYNEKQIKEVVESMKFAKEKGYSVRYRPHPRYSNISLLKKYVEEKDIEWPREVSIFESVSNLCYAVGSYSTVLTQAYFSEKSVILDDIAFRDQYTRLKDFKYILSNVGLPTLSQLQKELISK